MKTAYFITGTSKGIGKALAGFLLEHTSAEVFGYARGSSPFDHARYQHIQIDLSDEERLEQFSFPKTNAERIVLVNNAGLIAPIARVGQQDFLELKKQMNLNLLALVQLSNVLIHQFGNQHELLIVNVSSGAGKNAIDGWSTYCATKAAVDLFSETLQLEFNISKAKHKVFSIAPGVVDTPMQSQIRSADIRQFSRLNHFLSLKDNDELSSPEMVAAQLFYVIQNQAQFESVQFSLRDLEN